MVRWSAHFTHVTTSFIDWQLRHRQKTSLGGLEKQITLHLISKHMSNGALTHVVIVLAHISMTPHKKNPPSAFRNIVPIHYNTAMNTVTHTYSLRTTEGCISYCLTHATCVAFEYRPGSSPHCSLDSRGRFEAGLDWQPRDQYNYYDFYYDTKCLWTARTRYTLRRLNNITVTS